MYPTLLWRCARTFVAGSVLTAVASVQVWAATYELSLDEKSIEANGQSFDVLAINGQVPGPTLAWQEGEDVVINVTNHLDQPSSLHWHGVLLPAAMDGVNGLNGFVEIQPQETFTYKFKIRQAGTYWYHSHSAGQEQAGLYGAIVIAPKQAEKITVAHDYVVMLSDLTSTTPERILRNLKVDPGYYNYGKRTVSDFFADMSRTGVKATIQDRIDWGNMRMDPTDLADTGAAYTYLMNGKAAADNWTGLFKPGERVRLRFINGSAMSFYDVRIPGLKMVVVAADGQSVQPVPVDEFRIGVAETYDVIVTPQDNIAYTVLAEALDRSGYARGTLTPQAGMVAALPPLRSRTVLSMGDMGMDQMMGMDHTMPDGSMMKGMEHDMSAMDHTMPMDHAMMMAGAAPKQGWADAATPADAVALSYKQLRSAVVQKDIRAPEREIVVRLGGNMERYIWTLNGQTEEQAEPIALKFGERVRLKFVNETMMAHPMHLHGMFVQLENGQPADRLPNKHTVIVPPGQSYSVLLTADEVGEWSFHCHLLYHMASGMMTKMVVAKLSVGGQP